MSCWQGKGQLRPARGWRLTTGITLLMIILLLASSVDAQKDNKNKNKNKGGSGRVGGGGGGGGGNNSTDVIDEEETVTGPILTGDPQKDYIHDPNLPRELGAYDLSDYPFYQRPPKEGHNFTCDNRLDGFYASVLHKCQVYYNCLFGMRYDFLCANYTVFDQVNFICHYASEVDCDNSERYYDRNKELYVTTTTTTPAPQIIYVDRPRPRPIRPLNRRRPFVRPRPNRQRTATRAPPAAVKPAQDLDYYDYYDNNEYYDDYYYDDAQLPQTTTTTTRRPVRRRPLRKGVGGGRRREGVNQGPGGRRRRLRPGQGGRRVRTTTTTAAPAEYDYLDDYYYYDDATYDDAAAPASQVPDKQSQRRRAPANEPPRVKPGQRRRPNFRRSQDPAEDVPVIADPPQTAEEEKAVTNVHEELNAQVDAPETALAVVPDENVNRRRFSAGRRQSQRGQNIPAANRADSESLTPVAVNREGASVDEPPQPQVSSRRRIQTFRRPTAPTEQTAPAEQEAPLEEVAPRSAVFGFGGRRSRQ